MKLCLLALMIVGLLPAQNQLTDYLNSIGQKQLADRKAVIAGITNELQAKQRMGESRAKIIKSIGGLIDYRGPLNAVTVKTIDRGAYIIENVHFEALPNYIVTANLYRPKTIGKHPAVLFSLGHWDVGKPAGQRICANLASKGFVVLAYDPTGQGERVQAFDARVGRSLIGGSVEQHFMGGAQAVLAGETLARYFINDSRRAIDYLESRPEVDATKIGASGCSGGGTQTTYISALDDRIKVAAPACFMNSFEMLLSGPTGDSEQSFPGFLAAGLDQSDWVMQFAPKPWLISSTEQDFFTPAGAKIVYDQARQFYRVFDRESMVKWVVGPGGHGTPTIVREAIYEWMIHWLKDGKGDPKDEDLPMLSADQLCVYAKCLAPGRGLSEVIAESWKRRAVAGDVKSMIKLGGPATGLTQVTWIGPENSEELFVMIDDALPARRRAEALAALGCRIMLVSLPGHPASGATQASYSGGWIDHERAWLVGKNLPTMRANDLLHAVRPQLDRYKKVYVHAWGLGGVAALYAAHAEPRIAKVWLERMPHSLAAAMETPLHKHLHEAIVPGLALAGDFKDFTDKRVFWVDAADWNENVLVREIPGVYRRPFEQPDSELLLAFRKY